MPVHEFRALVPSSDGDKLPTVRVETETRAVAHALAAFAREHGPDAPFLRVGATEEATPSLVRTLVELDTPTSAPAGVWVPLDEALLPSGAPDRSVSFRIEERPRAFGPIAVR